MRLITVILFSLFSCVSFYSSAASVKVSWVGKVPSLGCASRPISNQTDFETLNKQCQSEFKIEAQQLKEQTQLSKNVVSFDV